MLDHVIIFLKKGNSIYIKNLNCDLLKYLITKQGYPISIKKNNDFLEITVHDDFVAVVNGYDKRYPDKYLDLIAIRYELYSYQKKYYIYNTKNQRLSIPYTYYYDLKHCYTSDGNFLITEDEYLSEVKTIRMNIIDILISN